ncbi:MAG: orotidine-5'-phosphate decarboxylase [Candidatus Omnitrophota bacterium]|nr:orotidine-5'-phosphate decarboxylase [Candidatus Omnitrophota bacterium]
MPKGLAANERLIVALDVKSLDEAKALADKLIPAVKIFKVGLGLFTLYGPAAVKMVKDKGGKVFLDLKFHDIPNTVTSAVKSASDLGVFILNVHTLGGSEMMRKAAEAVKGLSERPKILGVTILTSMDQKAINEVGIEKSVEEEVLNLATMARDAGLDGVVASPQETGAIRKKLGKDFIVVTPGVRPEWAAKGDQKRIATPSSAIKSGADYIVVGRPIIEADDPAEAAKKILEEMEI